MTPLSRKDVLPLIRLALREDAAAHDLTSRAVILPTVRIRARIVAKDTGILAGGPVAVRTFHAVDPSLRCVLIRREGAALAKGQTILTVEGRARSIFAAERTALNFLGHLSGIATLTHAFVQHVKPYPVKILDTRKTLPGLRLLEKYAVGIGGGHSHRSDLAEAILIKTNHVRAYSVQRTAFSKTIKEMVQTARRKAGGKFVEIEVMNFTEFKTAVEAKPDAILLDNWTVTAIPKAVSCLHAARSTLNARPLLEVSGGVTLANVRAIAKSGVDRISIGRLTHSAPALDLSLEVLL
ncbi:MAG: carboxylating nicotinate-nucleotide diphosphorylase [Candidatus Omnitrophica bacterium]|nr:carboxylating nicotinate-nucleotide diphosphorylase [Candidatus Omnitrophota bacterium]MBI3020966.1 carboxylating nicotinate-nucleotide diphosphorylase [Candidatus Omnitrophota bacterium]MBI3083833.1 carboxylating nicotinate-nucleotide diphosphorylase [Candidatus Omnitrophota bacterium]